MSKFQNKKEEIVNENGALLKNSNFSIDKKRHRKNSSITDTQFLSNLNSGNKAKDTLIFDIKNIEY